MAHVPISLGGDGGHDLDQITVNSADVRKNKVYVDADGNAQNGTMPDIAGRTITPGASQQTVSGGGYLTGNIVVPGFAMPAANILKKGAVYEAYGRKIVGTFQGWVGDAGDLYINGKNNAGITLYNANFQQDRITFDGTPHITSTKAYTLTEGQKLYVVCENLSASFGAGQSGTSWLELRDSDGTSTGTLITQIKWQGGNTMGSGFSFTMPRSLTFKPSIRFAYAANGWSGCIKRIYI